VSSLCDRAGYPVVELPEHGWAVQLLPVTTVQFECFLAEPSGYGDEWYEQLLELRPRVSLDDATAHNRAGLFMTGLLPREAEAYAAWQGPEWRVPTVAEWRSVYRALARAPVDWKGLRAGLGRGVHPLAEATLDVLRHLLQPTTMLHLSLMTGGGLLEWVRDGVQWVGLGEIASHPLHLPLEGEPIRPLHPERRRLKEFGLRLLRSLTPHYRICQCQDRLLD